jgi:hypothetical protein
MEGQGGAGGGGGVQDQVAEGVALDEGRELGRVAEVVGVLALPPRQPLHGPQPLHCRPASRYTAVPPASRWRRASRYMVAGRYKYGVGVLALPPRKPLHGPMSCRRPVCARARGSVMRK